MIDFSQKLNPAQYLAVTSLEGPVLVIAGAGSGKTRVIEYRVLNLIQNGVNPGSILLLTFTRKASREMISRASRHNPACLNVDGGTFHSFSYKTIRKYARKIGLHGGFIVMDESDSEEAVHRSAVRLNLYERQRRFPKKDTLKSIISMSINKDSPIGEVIQRNYPHFSEYVADIENLRKEYTAYKVERNYLDYDDLLLYMMLMLEDEEILARLADRFRYIMVDEYQDVNALQGRIACRIAEGHHNIMAVGDDAQSIYGFRGASHETIMDFPRRFPECKVIKLEENYRSSQAVLDVANAVLDNMQNKYSKCLQSARNRVGERPRVVFFRDAYEEAEWVADTIKRQLDEGIPLHHQCVLFRSMHLSIPLQSELSRRNIPYETYGGMKFYETAHVKDLMSHLKIIANPRDELAWNRALMLIERIGPKTAHRLTEEFTRYHSLAEMLEKGFARHVKGRVYSERIARLYTAFVSALPEEVNVGEKFAVLLDYYIPIMKERYDDWHVRLNDLETIRQVAMRYSSLEALLEDFALEPPERGVARIEAETKEEEKPLVLSTIHSSKGLEWDTVFIMSIVEGVLPITFALDSDEEIEEEQRLFYVAITRAKNRLFLTLHHEGMRGGIYQFNRVSRFIESPNVRAKLDLGEEDPSGQMSSPECSDGNISPFCDRGSLVDRLSRFYR